MQIRELMTVNPEACLATDSCAAAVAIMQRHVQAGRYEKAHRRLAGMTRLCVQGHQEHRVYGRFPTKASVTPTSP